MYGTRLNRFTATGDVRADNTDVSIQGFIVTPGTTATTITLRENGSGGAVVWTGLFAGNGPSVAFPVPFSIRNPHVTIAGTAAEVSFAF